MKKYIFDQSNGLWYELQGDSYIPCLVLDETGTSPIGMWGRKHQQYLKEHRPVLYFDLTCFNFIQFNTSNIVFNGLI